MSLDEVPEDFPLPGLHNRVNAALAIAVARRLGVAPTFAGVKPMLGRSHVQRLGSNGRSILLFDDCYNANPSSMEVAIPTCGELADKCHGRLVLVLGDMAELGDSSPLMHKEVLDVVQYVAGDVPALLVLIGEQFTQAASIHKHPVFNDRDEAKVHVLGPWHDAIPDLVASWLEPGDVVLLKASRSMRLERLIPAIEARFEQAR